MVSDVIANETPVKKESEVVGMAVDQSLSMQTFVLDIKNKRCTSQLTISLYLCKRSIFWGQTFCDTCEDWKCELGVRSHARLSEVAVTGDSSTIGRIACKVTVRANVSTISSSDSVLSVKFCTLCHWHSQWRRQGRVVNLNWNS